MASNKKASKMKKIDILNYFGSGCSTEYSKATAVANAIARSGYSINPQAINHWGPVVPELHARRMDEITGGKLKFDKSFYTTN